MNSDNRKAVFLSLTSLVGLCVALFYLVTDETGRMDGEALSAFGFLFALPSLFCVVVLLWAAWMSVRSGQSYFASREARVRTAVAGRCEHCHTHFSGQDQHCPGCGRSLSGRWILADMMSDRARDNEQQRTEQRRADMRIHQNPHATAAAQFLVGLAMPGLTDTADPVSRCMTDWPTTRELYRTAARRLHPDHNDGQHLPKWYELQGALKTLQTFHELGQRLGESG